MALKDSCAHNIYKIFWYIALKFFAVHKHLLHHENELKLQRCVQYAKRVLNAFSVFFFTN